jgi:hypothetical protein
MSEFAALGSETVRWPRPLPELSAVITRVAAAITTNATTAPMMATARRRRVVEW